MLSPPDLSHAIETWDTSRHDVRSCEVCSAMAIQETHSLRNDVIHHVAHSSSLPNNKKGSWLLTSCHIATKGERAPAIEEGGTQERRKKQHHSKGGKERAAAAQMTREVCSDYLSCLTTCPQMQNLFFKNVIVVIMIIGVIMIINVFMVLKKGVFFYTNYNCNSYVRKTRKTSSSSFSPVGRNRAEQGQSGEQEERAFLSSFHSSFHVSFFHSPIKFTL